MGECSQKRDTRSQLHNAGLILTGLLFALTTMPVLAEETENASLKSRGQMLYDNHCHTCHESQTHIRANRRAKSKDDIAKYVRQWSAHLQLNWSNADHNEVTTYLNTTYYHY